MKQKLSTISDMSELFRFVRDEHGEEAALIAVARMFSVDRRGSVERRPSGHLLQAACALYDIELRQLLDGKHCKIRSVARVRHAVASLLLACGYSQREAARELNVACNAVEYAKKRVDADEDLQAIAASILRSVDAKIGEPERRIPVLFPSRAA
jgi:hypothetical protein